MTTQMQGTCIEEYFPVDSFVMQYEVFQTLDSV